MRKRIVFLLIPLILGCNYLFPPDEKLPDAIPTRVEVIPAQPTESAPPTQVEVVPTPQVESTPAPAFIIVRIHKTGGDLNSQLASEVKIAESYGLIPFLEFDATWCPPCIAISESLDDKDPITMQAFAGTYIIRADVDEWGWGDEDKFNFDGIPIYFRLDYEGNPTGAVVDGNAWGENIPENFAPVLDEFFHTP
jgi:thiol-disulfide isomerase/thioredoxin